jgi:hypothetical protein
LLCEYLDRSVFEENITDIKSKERERKAKEKKEK